MRLLLVLACLTAPAYSYCDVRDTEHQAVKVMTLNVAHGRADGFSQFFQTTGRAIQNLDKIASVINRENPAIVAFQEIDSQSSWNGRFDHAEYLAKATNMDFHFIGKHSDNAMFKYGTGLVSQQPFLTQESISFKRNLLRPTKGFVLTTVSWPTAPGVSVDVVSVHLDFLSAKNRARQANLLIKSLQGRGRPMIVMGDFNSEVNDDTGLLPHLMNQLNLHTWQVKSTDLATYAKLNRRLDYVLVSQEFEFKDHVVLQDTISDHFAVTALLALNNAR